MSEPAIDTGPSRTFRDPSYRPLATNLGEVRANIDRLDEAIVALIAERAMYVKDAARFKHDAYQVSAPARQAQVFARVRRLSEKHDRGFDRLPDVVEATYRAMVTAFVANEQAYFDDMVSLGVPADDGS